MTSIVYRDIGVDNQNCPFCKVVKMWNGLHHCVPLVETVKNIYGTSNSESGRSSYATEKMLRCRKFRPKLGLPGSRKKSARESRVIPMSGVLTKVGSFDCQEFRPKSGLSTDVTKTCSFLAFWIPIETILNSWET